MWILGPYYGVNFDQSESEGKWNDWTSENYEEKVSETINQINQMTLSLTNGTETDDDPAKIEWKKLLNSLNSSLSESMEKYFKENPEQLKKLKTAVESSIAKLKEENGWKLPVEYEPLQNFLDKINQLLSASPLLEESKLPELELKQNVKLEWIEGVKWEQKFWKWIDQKEEWQEKSELDITRENLKSQIDAIGTIDVSKLPENVKGEIEQLKKLLMDINMVVDNTTVKNVQILQNFISENLEWEDKINFDAASKRANGKFDGKFGDGTLAWLKIVLEKTKKYIDDVIESLKQNEISDNLEKVKVKENATVKKNEEIKPENLVEGLSEWVTVALDEWQELKTDEVDKKIDVKLTAKSWEKQKPLVAKVTVVENSNNNSTQSPIDTTPLTVNGNQYLVTPNSQTIAQNAKLNWVIFYGIDNREHFAEWDCKCLMKIKGNPNVYEVIVDKNRNISPVAVNIDSKVSVLLKNNLSCKRYLAGKIPEALSPKPVIWWSSNKQDYNIQSYGKSLTIEPMTIRWDSEISSDLWECLVLENFVNFLRWSGEISDIEFKNNNPDLQLRKDGNLYVRVNKKSNRIYDEKWDVKKRWGWYKVPMQRFWLSQINRKVLENFIKYNNGEHWNDNWDKKKANKYYKKIDF